MGHLQPVQGKYVQLKLLLRYEEGLTIDLLIHLTGRDVHQLIFQGEDLDSIQLPVHPYLLVQILGLYRVEL